MLEQSSYFSTSLAILKTMSSQLQENEAVTNFRDYIRIPSFQQPNLDYGECVKFLSKLGEDIGLSVNVVEIHPKKPIVVMTLKGTNPQSPSVMLNSHMDVVPADAAKWTHHPFEAFKDESGNIYGRGTQDMKSIGIQYLESMRKIIDEGCKLKRTVHITFVPDEEIGGVLGMEAFVRTDEFTKLNVGFWLDEARANPGDEFFVIYGERTVWAIEIVASGVTGHGSLLPDNTAAEKIRYVITKMSEFREHEKRRLESDPNLSIGDVTTINLTVLKGGQQVNVIPSELRACFDIRIAPDVNLNEFKAMIKKWTREAGDGVYINVVTNGKRTEPTKLDSNNPWWIAFKDEFDKMGFKLKPAITPGATDGRFGRQLGIPVLGFSAANRTPTLLHDHDEFLNEKVFLNGIEVYYKLIKRLTSV